MTDILMLHAYSLSNIQYYRSEVKKRKEKMFSHCLQGPQGLHSKCAKGQQADHLGFAEYQTPGIDLAIQVHAMQMFEYPGNGLRWEDFSLEIYLVIIYEI